MEAYRVGYTMSIRRILEIVSFIYEFACYPLKPADRAAYFRLGPLALHDLQLVARARSAVQAPDTPVGVNSGLTLVVDSLGDPELTLIDGPTNAKTLMDVKRILKAFEPDGALAADALGNLLLFILV